MKYVGVDWAYRTARWCALAPGGEIAGEGRIAADRDGLARLVLELGDEVKACLEMMSGALWVRDQLVDCGCGGGCTWCDSAPAPRVAASVCRRSGASASHRRACAARTA